MQSLDPTTLVGYTKDDLAKKRFDARFRIPALLGLILFCGGGLWLVVTKQPTTFIFAVLAGGSLCLIVSVLGIRFLTPTSSSGRPMKKFWVDRSNSYGHEMIFVCDDTKTYFRRVFAKNSRARRL